MALLSVAEARARVLADVATLPAEEVTLSAATGRTLARDLAARRTQPPFRASAMDGYAVRAEDTEATKATLEVIGEAPAGRAFSGIVGPRQAVRIFTGAPVPEGADAVLIQENTELRDEARIEVTEAVTPGRNIRATGLDFTEGEMLLCAGTRLDWRSIALAAAMNYPSVPVCRAPRVAILATGDELVLPGEMAGPDQIIASNSFGIASFVAAHGGIPIDLGIAGDNRRDLIERVSRAIGDAPDILVTLGGASVGDHDIVRETLGTLGLDLGFWKVAMRPGKPLMFGRLATTRVLGLPGNPVSSLVGAVLYLGPLVSTLLGRGAAGDPSLVPAHLGADLKANDSRADYIRATLSMDSAGMLVATAFETQDSSMLRRFAQSDCLILRAPHAPDARAGDLVSIIRL